jgi:hypothetical protein
VVDVVEVVLGLIGFLFLAVVVLLVVVVVVVVVIGLLTVSKNM